MKTLPIEIVSVIVAFAPLFSQPVWRYAPVLLVGAILAPGQRTVTAALRVMGLSQEKHFQNYTSHGHNVSFFKRLKVQRQ